MFMFQDLNEDYFFHVCRKTASFRPAIVMSGVLVCLLSWTCQNASAGFMLSMSLNGTTPTITVKAGEQSADIPVYLLETGGETRLTTVGLFAAGATVTFQNGAGLTQFQANSARLLPH